MKIEQIEDKGLAHFSYLIMSDAEIAVIDPGRDPRPYEEFAMVHDARIIAIIETHPHADFVSGHLELSEAKQAPIYVSKRAGAKYKHTPFDEGNEIRVGQVTLQALNTPGHSPDSISVLLRDEEGKEHAVFTGDTLFIGDVGRPDLREEVGHETSARQDLARQMYHSTREKLMKLPDQVVVYPAHGAGSLCGKALSEAKSGTIGEEKKTNPALQEMTEDAFVDFLTQDQPFVPKYFKYAVQVNQRGAPKFFSSIKQVPIIAPDHRRHREALVIDTRPQARFKKGHLPSAINLQDGPKFETWLGSIVAPEEEFYLLSDDEEQLRELISRTARIGYEPFILGALPVPPAGQETSPVLDVEAFKAHPQNYTIIDIRNTNEVKEKRVFAGALEIPLPELRERVDEVPTDKPIVVHCAGGYRSAAGASILAQFITEVPVYDLSEAITQFTGNH
ncbi:MBL fold metallo-hydrolase [Rufibacter glacialis]|uniref:MBL fold metallo-hydrolase n=1 Tax=Rufibacter glacialis TaxID=1259555 RepID=A0A5M8QVC8_9BACT|nr:MBL fold metallo-hydrolase [Rufibacter glacialis]KAA6438082.1 MBL fold metallo-hydrolase [Rufibacter glacialis]GGK88397.1 Zn-dependent hydrolase [Rufibacter glacialis]